MIIMLTMTRLDDDDSGGSIPSILHDKWEKHAEDQVLGASSAPSIATQ